MITDFIYKKIKQHRETAGNFIWRLLQTIGKEGVLFLIFFLAAKFLGPFDFGIYSYILAVVFFLVIFSKFGIATATSRYVAEYNATDKDKLKFVLFNSGLLIAILSFAVIVLTVSFGKLFLGEHYILVLYVFPLVFLAPMSALYDGYYRGQKKFKQLAVISLSTGIVSAGTAYLLISTYGLIGALMAQNFLYFLLLIGLFLGYRELYFKLNWDIIRTIGSYSFLVGVSSLAYFLYSRVDIIILEQFGYITEIGYYEIINQAFMILFFPAAILGHVIAPNIAALNARREYSVILNKLKKFFLLTVPVGILVALLFYFLFPPLLDLFLREYHTSAMILVFTILIFLLPVKIWGVFLTQAFTVSTGYANIVAVATLIGGILNVIFDIIFINWIGFVGVFWVTLVVHALNILAQTIYYGIKISSRVS